MLAPFRGRLSLAAINAPEEMVISGDVDALREALAQFEAEGIKARALEVSHAFDFLIGLIPMLWDGVEPVCRGHRVYCPPHTRRVQCQRAAPAAGRHPRCCLRPPPRARAGALRRGDRAAVRAAGATVLIEIGPQPTLLGLAAKAEPEARWTALPSLRRGRDDRKEICAAAGGLHVRGAALDWGAVQAALPSGRAPLPTYPFQRERYWAQSMSHARRLGGCTAPRHASAARCAAANARSRSAIPCGDPSRISVFLADHVVFDTVLRPGTADVEAALAAARMLAGDQLKLENISIEAPLALSGDATELLHLTIEPWQRGAATFLVQSAPKGAAFHWPWKIHARGVMRRGGAAAAEATARLDTVAEARAQCTSPVDVEAYINALLARAGLAYGPAFRGIRELALGENVVVGTLEAPATRAGQNQNTPWILHPAMLDAAFHLLGLAFAAARPDALDRACLPVGMEGVSVRQAGAPQRVQAVARLRSSAADAALFLADLRLEDEAGAHVATITGLQLRPVEMHTLARALSFSSIASSTGCRRLGVLRGRLPRPNSPPREHMFSSVGKMTSPRRWPASFATQAPGANACPTPSLHRSLAASPPALLARAPGAPALHGSSIVAVQCQ